MKIKANVLLDSVLSYPKEQKESYDAFLIIAGSGKVDKNGNAKKYKFEVYSQISDYLNELGYATLRFDKRGVGDSEGDYLTCGVTELLEDIDALVNHLKQDKSINRVYLLGHSEGCLLSTLYSNTHNVDGLVLIAGAGTGLKDALRYQNEVVLEEIGAMKGLKGKLLRALLTEKRITKTQNGMFDKIEQSKKDVMRMGIVKINAKWMREHFQYQTDDYLEMLRNITIPVLAITGSVDVQANPKDLIKVAELGNENITIKVVEKMNHMLRYDDGPRTILNAKKQFKVYLKNPIYDGLLEEIKQFCEAL